MWRYEKRLQYPVKISQPNPKMAQFIMSQYGGPDGEMGASMRYLSQRYAMPYDIAKASLTDIGTEELAHLEIVAAIVHQLTRNLTPQEIEDSGFGPYYIDHTTGIWPQAAGGVPFNACEFQSAICGQGKLCISSVLEKHCDMCRISLTARTSMPLTRHLIQAGRQKILEIINTIL